MPKAAKKPCAFPRCGALVEYNERYCPAHKSHEAGIKAEINRRYDDNRPERHQFYQSQEWKRIRRRFLARHPLCELCLKENRVTAAVVVDHIVEIADGGALSDDGNLQALCANHHNRKTAAERRRRKASGVGGS